MLPSRLRHSANRKPMLLACGLEDRVLWNDICGATLSTIPFLNMTPGQALILDKTGHDLSNERPRYWARKIKDFLGRNNVPYQWRDLEADEEARQLRTQIGAAEEPLPLVLFTDGVSEATDATGELCGETRIEEVVSDSRDLDAAELQKTITPASLATLQSGGFGTFVAENLDKYTVYLGQRTPLEERLTANVAAVYNNLDRV